MLADEGVAERWWDEDARGEGRILEDGEAIAESLEKVGFRILGVFPVR
jgi:hypothetical protein